MAKPSQPRCIPWQDPEILSAVFSPFETTSICLWVKVSKSAIFVPLQQPIRGSTLKGLALGWDKVCGCRWDCGSVFTKERGDVTRGEDVSAPLPYGCREKNVFQG